MSLADFSDKCGQKRSTVSAYHRKRTFTSLFCSLEAGAFWQRWRDSEAGYEQKIVNGPNPRYRDMAH